MEPNDVLKFYYQRFKALKTGYEDTMRALGVMPEYNEAMTAHKEILSGMKFMNGLNSGYRHYAEYYEHRLKDWPDTLEDAYLEMTRTSRRRNRRARSHPTRPTFSRRKRLEVRNHLGLRKGKSMGTGAEGRVGVRRTAPVPGTVISVV